MYDIEMTRSFGLLKELCPGGQRATRSLRNFVGGLAAALFSNLLDASVVVADQVTNDLGNPVMASQVTASNDSEPRVHLIFWIPAKYDVLAPGLLGNTRYENVMKDFFDHFNYSDYSKILYQYAGPCLGIFAPFGTDFGCSPGLVFNTDIWVDNTSSLPHMPLMDSDIRDEIKSRARNPALNPKSAVWGTGLGHLYIVFLGMNAEICDSNGNCGGVQGLICGYHDSFQPNGTSTNDNNMDTAIIYAVTAHRHWLSTNGGGCGLTESPAPELSDVPMMDMFNYVPAKTPHQSLVGTVDADWQTVTLSHEFFEALTDPLGGTLTAWYDSNGNDKLNGEIGDLCGHGMVGGGSNQKSDGSNAELNGAAFLVQEIWNNPVPKHNLPGSCALTPQ
jgi:hypothetical protein